MFELFETDEVRPFKILGLTAIAGLSAVGTDFLLQYVSPNMSSPLRYGLDIGGGISGAILVNSMSNRLSRIGKKIREFATDMYFIFWPGKDDDDRGF